MPPPFPSSGAIFTVICTQHPPLMFLALIKLKLNKSVDCLSSLLDCQPVVLRIETTSVGSSVPTLASYMMSEHSEHSINNISPLLSIAKLFKSSFSFTTHSLFCLLPSGDPKSFFWGCCDLHIAKSNRHSQS